MSGPVVLVARAQARRRWRAGIALTLFIGLVGGLSIALIAGSRRSASVVDRYLATARHYDASLFENPSSRPLTQAEVLAMPGVTRADRSAYVAMVTTPSGSSVPAGINGIAANFAAIDPTIQVLAGTAPDGRDPFAIAVNKAFVAQFGRTVGDTVDVQMFGLDQGDAVSNGVYEPSGPHYKLHIAALVRTPQDIATNQVESPSQSGYANRNQVFISNEFYEAHRSEFLDFGSSMNINVHGGSKALPGLEAAIAARTPEGEDAPFFIPANADIRRGSLDTPVNFETTGLVVLGIGIAIASALAVALIVRADQRSHDADTPILRALGCSVPQLGASAAIRMLPAALGGALLAVGFAVVLSARFPIGIGREIELDPGLDANLAILGLGALLIVILVELCAFAFGRPRRQHAVAPANRRTMARWLGNSGAPTDLTIASHLTFDRGQGVRSVPSRQAIIGGATLLAVLTAVGVYVSGVDHLYAVPAAHGWPWDAAIGNINFPLSQDTADRIDRDPRIAAHTSAHYGSAKVNGQLSEFLAFDPQGDAPPDVVTGRLPRTAHEVALGDATMRDLGLHLGSTVKLSIAGSEFDAGDPTTPLKLKVVGVALAPEFGDMDVGKVGLVPLDAIAAAGGLEGPQLELVKVSPGHRATTIAALDRSYTEEMATNLVPAQVVNLHRVRSLALLGFGAAALMGLFVFLYVLVVSARARTHEIAVLRSLGLRARQLRRILAWQGSLLAAGMTLIGIPLGILLGAALWGRVARSLGMHHTIEVNPRLLILVPLVFLFAVVASLYTARRTLHAPINLLLRTE